MTLTPAQILAASETLDALVACAAREARLRESVYPKFVAQGRMTTAKADEELFHMQAIAALLTHLRDRAAGVREFDFG